MTMTKITEDYVSFETAKLLKEKGFDEFTLHYYVEGHLLKHYSPLTNSDTAGISAPTLQMAMKWLREVHSIHIVTVFLGHSLKWTPTIWKIDMVIPESKHVKSTFNTWETYEEACEAAIKYCLENLI